MITQEQKKIPAFESLPLSELSKLNDDENDNGSLDKLRSIEKEFADTNLHTKQTQESDDNTDNTGNTANNINTDATIPIKDAKKNRLGKIMGGSFPVELIDMLIPTVVVLIVGYFGYVLEKKDLKLTKDEKEAITPAVQDVLDEINIDFSNPYINLGVILAIVYGTKIADKLPTLKKKTVEKPIEKKGMTEAVNSIITDSGEAGEDMTDMGKFETDYGKAVDEIRLSRKRGVGDAKEYLANNYPEKIKAIAKKHHIPLNRIEDKLEFTWTPKKRKPKDAIEEDFNLPE